MKKLKYTTFLAALALCLAAKLSGQRLLYPENAVAHYSFTGNTQNELSGSYHLNVVGASLTLDRFGNSGSAYRFDGTSAYMISSQLLPDMPEFTLSTWIRPASDHTGAIFYDAQGFTPGEDTILRVQTGKALYGIADKGPSTASFVSASSAIQINQWQHVALVARGDFIGLYVNGVLVSSDTSGGNNVEYHSNFYIGAENHGFAVERFFHGDIDEFTVYDRALTSSEVALVAAIPGVVSLDISNAVWLEWDTALGVNYQVQSSFNLEDWADTGTPIAGTGGKLSFSEKLSAPRKFYRLIITTAN